jgi:hypothetical protein
MYKCLFTYKDESLYETVASRWFMRGTDPIKSTWVYPKFYFYLIINIKFINTVIYLFS